ncbi:MAG: SufD family Fe-S cluster assembly protein [Bdellovibrionales bacterium]|nr:SufD family Fe-S cluster assembly protein [Bdellovibrionales bacterium]
MKEFILFKNSADFSGTPKSVHFRALAGESRFHFQEVREAGAVYEIEIHAAPESSLEVVVFQNIPEGSRVWIRIRVAVEAEAKLNLIMIQNGGENSQVEIDSTMLGKGARIELRGLQNAKKNQKFSIRAEVLHGIPNTSSDLQIWCAARDDSRSVFSGSVRIGKGAHHTEAFQKNRNLMLSRRAIVDSFPKLFIENDNVKCSHGSSTSTLEPDQLYYLQSRGISADSAEGMMIQGFLREAVSGISDQACREEIQSKLGILDEEWA